MQNIDPIYFLYPVIVITFSFGLLIYWHYKRTLSKWVLIYSAIAYGGAIILKEIVQVPTIGAFETAVGGSHVALGIYYGLQTVVFEVGGAYLLAWFAFRHGHLKAQDAEGYGLSLAFWENGILIGLLTAPLSILDLASYYSILSSGTNSLSQLVYSTLSTNYKSLFLPPAQALPGIGLAILERISSLLAHLSWGYLVVLSVVFRRKLFLAIALPMGLIDFSVPFAGVLGAVAYEFLIFAVSVMFLVIALTATRSELNNKKGESKANSGRPGEKPQSLGYMNFRRAISYGKLYLIIAIVISILYGSLLTLGLRGIASNPTAGVSSEVSQLPVVILPLFAIMGSFGSLMVFVSDKDKGVYEYLIAYGTEPSSIFWSIVAASLGLVSIVLVASISSSVGIQIISNVAISPTFIELVAFYVIPISYAATAFGNMAGMIWSSLTKRRVGVNSPVGLAPIIGIVPVIFVLLLTSFVGPANFIPLVGGVSGVLLLLVVFMIATANKKMVRERFLSSE